MKAPEKTGRYMTLFGLEPGFSEKDLSRSYRTLAKLNHPDTAKDPDSVMRMVIINDAYEYLKDILAGLESMHFKTPKAPPRPRIQALP